MHMHVYISGVCVLWRPSPHVIWKPQFARKYFFFFSYVGKATFQSFIVCQKERPGAGGVEGKGLW